MITESELLEMERRAAEATAGPWFVRFLDDSHAMNLTAVSTSAGSDGVEAWPNFDATEIVAATLIQAPRYADIADDRWDANAEFIAHAREDMPRLIAEIRRLRASH
jgi:hypothetical protein